MLELLGLFVFIWLLAKAVGLAWKLTWGVTKIIASILMGLAMPLVILCLVFASGVALIVPIAVIGLAVGVLKACA